MFCSVDVVQTGQNIKMLREQMGMSVKQLSEHFSELTSEQSIYGWQQGKYLPSYENMLILSMIFHKPIEEIVAHKMR